MGGRSVLLAIALLTAGCQAAAPERSTLCGANGTFRVGYVGAAEGQNRDAAEVISASDLERMRRLMTVASRCPVEFEPLLSPERARQRLRAGHWDMAFLPPGLTALAMQAGTDDQPVRALMQGSRSRSALLVLDGSPATEIKDLNGRRLGLLPRGSLTGFYLPLYNLHGLQLQQVRYAISYADLLHMLRSGGVDAIAWDSGLPSPGPDVRVLAEDGHEIPPGGMVLSAALLAEDHKPLLATLDASADQMPQDLGYSATAFSAPLLFQGLRDIVRHVESWTLPKDGQPYTVYRTVVGGEP